MGNDISWNLSSMTVCFDFRSTNVGSSVIRTRTSTGLDWLSFCFMKHFQHQMSQVDYIEDDYLTQSGTFKNLGEKERKRTGEKKRANRYWKVVEYVY